MNLIYKIGLLLLLLVSSASSCEEKDANVLLQDMVSFDQAFIPVLYYVRQGEMDNARESVFFLNHSWQKFQNKYKNRHPESDDWQETFRMTDAWLSDAYLAIDAGLPRAAYIFLDHVRYQFIDLRFQHKLKYDLDEIWEYEANLDVVEEVAIDQMLCLLDYCEFEKLVEDLNEAWRVIRHQEIDTQLFALENDEVKNLNRRRKRLHASMNDFNQAVMEGGGENLAMTATFVRQAYLDYLACFGDFLSSKHYYASLW